MNQRIKRVFFRRRFNMFSNAHNAFWTLCEYFRKSIEIFVPGYWKQQLSRFNREDPISEIRKRVDRLEKTMAAPYQGHQVYLRKVSVVLFGIILSCFMTGWDAKHRLHPVVVENKTTQGEHI